MNKAGVAKVQIHLPGWQPVVLLAIVCHGGKVFLLLDFHLCVTLPAGITD